ncbi:MAG TPA: TIGR02680 family protein [Anaerovoracaceae bacterium]|nr:TIGR02680 family protein [Anaerovoracaceae bacterium]
MLNNRWKMNRMGFINFWLYDEEEFSFSDGKLLLRGANASGKSITTQSFIPFILDGDRTPNRLDPFGSSDRKMEYYFLGNGEREDVTGYLFLEFKKTGTDQYRTIGIGQRAQKGKPMDFWGFLILDGRRVGYDVQLYKAVGSKKIPFTKQDLKKELGEDNPIAEKQKDYMELVNKHIFGFPRIEQYDQFIRLMIKVRAPKLSRDFKPTKVYEILNESLQSLSDEDLRAMVDAMEKMDDIQNKLDGLKAAFRDVTSIRTEYDHYNRYMLSKKAGAYLSSQKQVEAIRNRLEALQDEVRGRTEEKSRKEEENDSLGAEIELLEKEKELLAAGNLESYFNKLEYNKSQKTMREEEAGELSRRIEASRQKIRLHDSDLRQHKKDEESYRSEVDHILQELDHINETLRYEGHKLIAEAVRQGAVRDVLIEKNKELKEFSDLISKGLKALQEFSRMEEEWSRTEEELNGLSIIKSICEEQLKTAEGMETQCRDDLVEAFYGIADKYKELILGKQELTDIVPLIGKYQGPRDMGDINKIINGIRGSRERALWKSNIECKVKRGELYSLYRQSVQELEALKNKGEVLPLRREKVMRSRAVLEEKGIPCLPFYKAVEFDASLPEDEQALIEEQLFDTGLLDALIVAPKDYQRARTELSSLSDALIQADAKVCTGYGKLIPGEAAPELKNAVEEIINNIYGHDKNGAGIVLSPDGYYRNGVIEGHSVLEGQASFVGATARRNKWNRMIAEKEAECGELKNQLQECDEMMKDIQASIETLDLEYRGLPGFNDLDSAVDMVRDAAYELDKASDAYSRKAGELSQILGRKKEWEQKVIASCKGLPYDRTPSSYEGALEDMESYKYDLTELEKAVNYLDTARSKCESVSALIEKEEEAIDHADGQWRKAERQIRLCAAEIGQIEEYLNRPENKERAERLEKVIAGLKAKNGVITSNREAIARLEEKISLRSEEIDSLRGNVTNSIEKENTVRSYFQEELELKYVIAQENKTISECAEEAAGCIRENDKHKTVGEIVASLYRVYQQHNSNLTSYGTSMEDCFDDAKDPSELRKRQIIVSTWQGRKLQLEEFYNILKESIDSTELLIREKDRILFEDILADTLSRKLSNRITESRNWIADMSKLMREMDTSMGLTFSLDWKPCVAEGEKELDTRELEKLLSRDRELLTHEDIEKVSAHFRSKIQMTKQVAEDNGESVNYADMVRDALDYRKWFEFKMNFYRGDEQKKELTNSAFNKFSGGEKAMAMYVPLFAAVNAQYKKTDNPNHPRIIALDEAFAGVDDKNISSMFELVQKLDFDYIMNSQALWGCYETVKSLKIAELLRPANADVVTVIYYHWNGTERILDEQ